jgi:hypothetical protein
MKAKSPEEIKPGKPKFLLSGKSGVGKTMFALEFPKPYIIDVEGGATREHYVNIIKKSGGAYLGKEEGSQDFKVIIEEIKSLTSENHNYKTLIIDSFTKLYLLEAAKAEEKLGSDFGKDKKEANKPTRQLLRFLEKIPMTVILICHSVDRWVSTGPKERVCDGTTFDGYPKLEFDLDLWMEITKVKSRRFMTVRKSRVKNFIEGDIIDLSYKKFCELYGEEIVNSEPIPVKFSEKTQIEKINFLLQSLRIEQDVIDKWFTKANVETWEEMSFYQADKCIQYLELKVTGLKK